MAKNLALATITATGGSASRSFGDRFGDVKNVKDFGATGDGATNDKAAIQAAIDACDSNRGGVVFFPIGAYRIATGLTVVYQGTVLVGQGRPGVTVAEAQGSTRIVSDNGVTAITFAAGSHVVRGYGIRNLHVRAASGATTGNGILVTDTENFYAENVTCSDYIGGYGLSIDGTVSSNGQYGLLMNYSGGDCLTGLHIGYAANAIRVIGGYFAGAGTTPRASSRGIHIEHGDTHRIYGVVVQGYATGIDIQASAADAQLFGPRLEFCNIGIRTATRRTHLYGGSFDNFLLGGGGSSIAVQLDSGATNCYIHPADIQSITSPLIDNSADVTNEFHFNSDSSPWRKYPGKSAAPTSGAHILGEIVWHSAPAAGGNVGWICTTAGTPGTWKTFGAIQA